MLSEISQRKTNTIPSHLDVQSEKTKAPNRYRLLDTEWPGGGGAQATGSPEHVCSLHPGGTGVNVRFIH